MNIPYLTSRAFTTLFKRLSCCVMAGTLLNSCAEVARTLEDPNRMAALGGLTGAVIGSATGNGQNNQQRALMGGLIGAGAGAGVSLLYKASLQQRRYAQEQANYALASNNSVMRGVKASGASYVAVPVQGDSQTGSKRALVRVKVSKRSDGSFVAGKAEEKSYPVTSARNGSVVNVGGQNAVFYNP